MVQTKQQSVLFRLGLGIAALTPQIFVERSGRDVEEYERIARPIGNPRKKGRLMPPFWFKISGIKKEFAWYKSNSGFDSNDLFNTDYCFV